MTIDVESQLDRTDYLNQTEANKHPRFEMSTVRTWEYDEYWIVSESGTVATWTRAPERDRGTECRLINRKASAPVCTLFS